MRATPRSLLVQNSTECAGRAAPHSRLAAVEKYAVAGAVQSLENGRDRGGARPTATAPQAPRATPPADGRRKILVLC